MEIAEAIFAVLLILTLGIATAVLSRMVKVNPIVDYLFLGTVVSAVGPELLSAGGTVHLLAELGVVFLLFDIGLHFSTTYVRREAGDIFGFGPLQVSASTILIAGRAWALGLSPIAALVVGTTLALSSTAIVAGVIADRRQQNCPVALTAIAILIFQDVVAIFLLILTTTLENGSAGPSQRDAAHSPCSAPGALSHFDNGRLSTPWREVIFLLAVMTLIFERSSLAVVYGPKPAFR